MHNSPFLRWALFLLLSFMIMAGCSSRFDPMAPERSESDGPILADPLDQISGDRVDLDFEETLKLSEHGNYTTISGVIGVEGGSFSGTVTDYEGDFSLQVPAGACQGFSTLKILVPNEGIPVYQLLPHTNFGDDVTVTLGYSKWLDEDDITDGHLCEVLYMNEETEAFEQLSPRALFTADADSPAVSFTTDHFSRWSIEDLGEN